VPPEQLLDADQATASPPRTVKAVSWDETLDAVERHIAEIHDALAGRARMPEPYTVLGPSMPLPQRLAERAGLLLAAERDLEAALRTRVGTLAAALHRVPGGERSPGALYVDRFA
jgi:hypothetical protein